MGIGARLSRQPGFFRPPEGAGTNEKPAERLAPFCLGFCVALWAKKKPGNDLLSHGLCRSTIGAGGLNFRVRNGNGWDPSAMVTRQFDFSNWWPTPVSAGCRGWEELWLSCPGSRLLSYLLKGIVREYGQASRKISTGRLNTLPHLDRQPIDQIFSLVPSVSLLEMGCLILRKASHLDAFSGYPVRTWLPSTCRWHDNWYTRGTSTPVLSY